MNRDHLRVVPDSLDVPESTTVPVACNRCGQITEAVVVLRVIRSDWVVASFPDAQAQIRDNHPCKETQQ